MFCLNHFVREFPFFHYFEYKFLIPHHDFFCVKANSLENLSSLYNLFFSTIPFLFLLYISLCNSFTSTHILVRNEKEKRIANFSGRRTWYTLIKLYPSRTPYSRMYFQKQYFFQPARAPKRTDLVKWTLAERHSPWRNPMGVTRNELYTRCLT